MSKLLGKDVKMMHTLEVRLYIRHDSGCPLGTNTERVSVTKEGDIWIIQRPIPQENEKKGRGITQRMAVIDWFFKNMGGD